MKYIKDWNKSIIHCPTKEESDAICDLIEKAGGGKLHRYWKDYKEKTCYYLTFPSCSYCYREYFEEKYSDAPIFSASDFLIPKYEYELY